MEKRLVSPEIIIKFSILSIMNTMPVFINQFPLIDSIIKKKI